MARSNAWKYLEKTWAEVLNKYGLTAWRISRAGNYSVSDYDVGIKEFPNAKSDAKYSVNGHKTNRLLDTVENKYCNTKEDFGILITKGFRERGQKTTVDSEILAMLLAHWAGTKTKEELWNIYLGK